MFSKKRTITPVVALVLSVSLGLAACGDDDDGSEASDPTSPSESTDAAGPTAPAASTTVAGSRPPSSGGPVYVVELSGAAEVPGPGDEDGSGTLALEIGAEEVCINGEVDGTDEITEIHLHSGTDDEPSEEADTTIDLGSGNPGDDDPLAPFPLSYCITADPADLEDLTSELAEDPGDYLVNVHTAEFPDGAVRGQLATA